MLRLFHGDYALKKIIISVSTIIVVLLLGLVVSSYYLPSAWKVERTIVINTKPDKIYPLVANFKNGWSKWSSFDYEDPEIQYTYNAVESGLGAERSWVSKKMGDGEQKIVSVEDNALVQFELKMARTHFLAHGEIALIAIDDVSTRVTWTDWGEADNNPFNRWMAFFIDAMMGPGFEKSLSKLKEITEVTP